MKKTLLFNLALMATFAGNAYAATQVTEAEIKQMTDKTSWTRGSVHDPSITYATVDGVKNYYVFGSHMGVDKTTDLKNWSVVTYETTTSTLFCDANGNVCSYADAYSTNKVTSVKNYAGKTVNWGNFDIHAYQGSINDFTVAGNQWAPDIIYNPNMKKWCYYMSLNGSKWNSAIVLFTSDNVEGPYQYQGPIVFSGFNVTTNAATDYTKTDMQIALGSLSSLPSRYNVGDQWGTYWPHAIDPGVFFDANGELWMNYGSWSGGIYILKLDKNTGLRDYTYTYTSDYDSKKASVTSDPYFGKKLGGGYYVSGEGSYIEKIGTYYYLFISYGFYSPEGGYEMRVFRSTNPDGPYTDYTGESAIYTKYLMNYGTKATTNRGMKIMGGYQWEGMSVAEIAQGHNSALLDEDGKAYLVCHTKFNDGTAGHALRVHQLFVNQDGWITAAPHEYNDLNDNATMNSVATQSYFSKNEIVGTYSFILHKYKVDYANYEYTKPVNITLNSDGSVSGSYTGTWSLTNGTSYITLTLGGVTYKGEVVPGSIDATNYPVVAITAMSTSNGVNIWASKLTDKGCIAKDVATIQEKVSDGDDVYSDLSLGSGTGSNGSTYSWTSSNTSIITNDGSVASPKEDTPVKLTLTISKGDYTYTKDYTVTAKAGGFSDADISTGLVAYYNFDNNLINQYNTSSVGTANAQASGTKPTYDSDSEHGTVLHQYFGYNDASSISYTTFDNPLKGQSLTGATVSAWIKRLDTDAWDAIWSFCDGSFGNVNSRLYLTGNTYMGFNNGSGTWFDYNHPNTGSYNIIPANKWALVTFSFNTNGFDLYIDGKKVADQATYEGWGASGSINYQDVLNHLSSSTNVYLGYGSFWGSNATLFDDLLIWNRALSATDVARLYVAETDGESLMPGQIASGDTAVLKKRGAGGSNQTLKIDSALVDYYYEWENATGVIVNGLPNGITATIDKANKKVTFSGVAKDTAGTYKYTITTTGVNPNITLERTITIVDPSDKTGIDNIAADGRLKVYPNPTDGEINIQFQSAEGNATLSVMNLSGQTLQQETIKTANGISTYKFNLKVANGTYIVVVKTANNIWHQTIVKK